MSRAGHTRIDLERVLGQADIDAFAALSGDDNPIHLDAEFASHTAFGRTVAHGMLLYTMLRGLMEELLPGARQRVQELMFPAPAYAGDTLRFRAEIIATGRASAELALSVARAGDGTTVCTGRAIVALEDGKS